MYFDAIIPRELQKVFLVIFCDAERQQFSCYKRMVTHLADFSQAVAFKAARLYLIVSTAKCTLV